jgi:hypothetical protein
MAYPHNPNSLSVGGIHLDASTTSKQQIPGYLALQPQVSGQLQQQNNQAFFNVANPIQAAPNQAMLLQ